jgi:hypothetical protein
MTMTDSKTNTSETRDGKLASGAAARYRWWYGSWGTRHRVQARPPLLTPASVFPTAFLIGPLLGPNGIAILG